MVIVLMNNLYLEKCIVKTSVKEGARSHGSQINASSIARYVVKSASVCL